MIRKFKFETGSTSRLIACRWRHTESWMQSGLNFISRNADARARREVDDLSRSRGFRGGTECAENLHRRNRAGADRFSCQILCDDARRSANPPDHPPQVLVQHARVSGVELDEKAWAALDDDQRYALIKLGDSATPSHNLEVALQEFFESGSQTEAS